MHKPNRRILIHSCKHYRVAYTTTKGEKTPSYTFVADVACNWQEPLSNVVVLYSSYQEEVKASVFILDSAIYDAIGVGDRLTYQNINYRIIGRQNIDDRAYRLDVQQEVK